jgi:hypothetical protein
MMLASIVLAAALSTGGSVSAQAWATATSTNASNGRVVVFRYIGEFVPGFERHSQPVRVILVWKYKGHNGMPVRKDSERMDAMEDLLAPLLEREGFASLALVSTGENLREWIYYAASEDGFLARLNEALGGEPAFPIEIHAADDPAWANYQEFIDGLQDKGTPNKSMEPTRDP